MEDPKVLKSMMRVYIDQIDDSHLKLLQTNCALLRAAVVKSQKKLKEGEL